MNRTNSRSRPSAYPAKDSASLDWKSVMFGGGVFDNTGEHPNKKGWDIFELGQKSFWAVPLAIDWDADLQEDPEFAPHIASMLTFLCPGEKAAVTGAAYISNLVRSEEAKFYFVEQALEEAKHHDALRRVIPKLTGQPVPEPTLWIRLLYSFGVVDKDDAAFMMGSINIIGEHLANQIFHRINHVAKDESLKKLIALIGKDESRHIAAGQKFFDEVRPEYERRRMRIMAKNLATTLVLIAASYDLVNPMNALKIDLGDVLAAMYKHYNEVTGGRGGFMEEAIVDFLMKNIQVGSRRIVQTIGSFTDSDGNIEPQRLIASCEHALRNPRVLREFFA